MTITREPRDRLSATFSAISRQHTTSKNEVASSHSWVWRFCHRRLTANPKLAVAWPVLVNRSSGSRVMFPTSDTLFPLAIGQPSFDEEAAAASARRPATLSGNRITLWRSTSSAKTKTRSMSATAGGSAVSSMTT